MTKTKMRFCPPPTVQIPARDGTDAFTGQARVAALLAGLVVGELLAHRSLSLGRAGVPELGIDAFDSTNGVRHQIVLVHIDDLRLVLDVCGAKFDRLHQCLRGDRARLRRVILLFFYIYFFYYICIFL